MTEFISNLVADILAKGPDCEYSMMVLSLLLQASTRKWGDNIPESHKQLLGNELAMRGLSREEEQYAIKELINHIYVDNAPDSDNISTLFNCYSTDIIQPLALIIERHLREPENTRAVYNAVSCLRQFAGRVPGFGSIVRKAMKVGSQSPDELTREQCLGWLSVN